MKLSLDYKKFSTAIKQKRIIDLNMELRDAAKKANISASTLSRLENNKMPDLLTYASVCKWLSVPMESFIIKSKKI